MLSLPGKWKPPCPVARYEFKEDFFALQNNLAAMLEIDGNAIADDRLDLPHTPFGTGWMPYDGSHFEKFRRHGRAP